MSARPSAIVAAAIIGLVLMPAAPVPAAQSAASLESLPFAPRHALCYRIGSPLQIDGKLDEPQWRAASWSEPFVDITGDDRRRPRLRTRVKMLWDAEYFYVGADLEEPDVWATLTERDSVIFHDNDFEVFIDPDGDTHNYYELEVNALATVWDLFLVRPYRDGGPALNGWDIAGLLARVDVRGTPNHPGDRDDGWSVEIAMPWTALREAAPGHNPPVAGDQWRVNFSRVEWPLDAKDAAYVKRTIPGSANLAPEDNWVWSPQGAVAMHMPERWGVVQFSMSQPGDLTDRFVEDLSGRVEWALRRLYYRQADFLKAHGRYAADLRDLHAGEIQVEGLEFRPSMQATDRLYEISAPAFGAVVLHVSQDGRVWRTQS